MGVLLVRTGVRIGCWATLPNHHAPHQHPTVHLNQIQPSQSQVPLQTRRGLFISTVTASTLLLLSDSASYAGEFSEIPDSGGVKALDLRIGTGPTPVDGDQVAIHYYGRLAAKQGWRFDSTYDHKDGSGEPVPFVFVLGSGKVISGIQTAVRSMKIGGVRRVIIPPSQGYQTTSQEPLPPNFFDRQRLFTTIFNPTRIANGEGSTLGTLIFDIELVTEI
ncbi:hypothetical protein V2J09_008353 [Rumex salicifolius]